MIILALLLLLVQPAIAKEPDPWRAEEYYRHSSSQKEAAHDLLKFVKIQGNERILDVGCGDGKITAEIAAKLSTGSILGIDISSSMIQFAQANFPEERFPNLKFALQDAQDIYEKEAYDLILSFTALMWVKSHEAFLKGAYESLKPSGQLAVTMTMGLPAPLKQAVAEMTASPAWSSYFQNFSTGWNFVQDHEYGRLLSQHHFEPSRLAVVPQKDIFPSRAAFEGFISQWFPYLRPLPASLKQPFLKQVLDRFFELDPPPANGEIHFKVRRLEVVARKNIH